MCDSNPAGVLGWRLNCDCYMKRLILVLFCCLALPVVASHIVGGEFELLHVSGNTYRLNMTLYFDSIHGVQGAKDPSVLVKIFRKRDNASMMDVLLQKNPVEPLVSYTQPSCSHGEIITKKLTYTAVISLTDELFNDAQGYYVVWERCCRNYGITNIYSEDIQNGGSIYAGVTFYMEFPPVVKNGRPFINSSPHLFPPLNDYACPKRPYAVFFGGVDDDGDSLAYSLVAPLNTQTGVPVPIIGPLPYPDVTWRNPFSLSHVTGGNPDLAISADGMLRVTPNQQGLYVFAVRCDQYRDGTRIGQTRRDFQMLVVDACPISYPPQIVGKKLADADFTYSSTMNITFSNTVDDADRCIEIRVSDPDSDSTHDGQENITIKAVALNFKKDVSGILPAVTNATLVDGSTKTFRICFDKCPYIDHDVPYEIGIVAYDDACALPLTDTLRVSVSVQPPANNSPRFTTPDVTTTMHEGDPTLVMPIQAVDTDNDPMTFFLVVRPPFNLDSAGLKLSIGTQKNDTLNASLTWDPRCATFDYVKNKNLKLTLLVGSPNSCGFMRYDTMKFDLKMLLMNSMPQFTITSLDQHNPIISNAISITVGQQQIALDLRGVENNPALQNNLIDIRLLHAEGNIEPAGYSFSPVQRNGSAETTFIWNPDCSIFQDKIYENDYLFTFSMIDKHCITPEGDTVTIAMTIKDVDGTDAEFSPRNFISPNDDGFNDYFAMEGTVVDRNGDATDIDGIVHFPKDNCDGKFEQIRIYNRWGREMFKSEMRDFHWYAEDAAVGVYYYFLKFTHKEYKGTITVRF